MYASAAALYLYSCKDEDRLRYIDKELFDVSSRSVRCVFVLFFFSFAQRSKCNRFDPMRNPRTPCYTGTQKTNDNKIFPSRVGGWVGGFGTASASYCWLEGDRGEKEDEKRKNGDNQSIIVDMMVEAERR